MSDSVVGPRIVGRGSINSGSSASDLSEAISDMSLSTSPGSDMPSSMSTNNMADIILSTNSDSTTEVRTGNQSTPNTNTNTHPKKKRVMRQLSSNPYLASSEMSPDDQLHPVKLGANSYAGEPPSEVFDRFYFNENENSSPALGFRANSYPLSSSVFTTTNSDDSQEGTGAGYDSDIRTLTKTSFRVQGDPDVGHNNYYPNNSTDNHVDFSHQSYTNVEPPLCFQNETNVFQFPPFHSGNSPSQPHSQYEIESYERFKYNHPHQHHQQHHHHQTSHSDPLITQQDTSSPVYSSQTDRIWSHHNNYTPSPPPPTHTPNNNNHHHRRHGNNFIPNSIPASESCPSTAPPHFNNNDNNVQLRWDKERHQSEGSVYTHTSRQDHHQPQSREINSWGHFSKHTERHYKYRRSHCNSSDSDDENQRFYKSNKPLAIHPDKSQSHSYPHNNKNIKNNTNTNHSSTPLHNHNQNHHSHSNKSSSPSVNNSSRVTFSKNQSEFSANDKASDFHGVKPQVFKDKFQSMKRWFADCNDGQKNVVLKGLLKLCDLPQLHLLSVHMSRELHHGCPSNCEDILTWLPATLATKVMTYLDPVSLCQAAQVCRVWRSLAEDQSLWRRFCCQTKWRLSKAAEHKQVISHMSAEGSIQWKNVFAERFRLRNNWLKGRRTVRTFEGHHQGISCVQFDDSRIVSGSSDKTIKVWNMRTNAPWSVQTLMGHHGTVRCLHLEGNRLVSGSCDATIKVWDLSTEESWSSIACKVTMTGHSDTVRCLQADDDKVISGSYDKTLKIWDLKSGELRQTLRGHQGSVLCVHFSETKIVSGSVDKTIKVWNHEGSCMNTLCGHQDAVTCLMFDSTRIVSGSLDHNLKFWDVHSGECLNTIDWKMAEGHTGVVRCLQADSWRLVSAGDDKTIKVWNLSTGERLVTLRDHTDGVTCLQFNDFIIVSGSYDKTVKLWDFSCC